MRIEVPAGLAASHRYYSGEAGSAWVAALPGLAESLLRRWELRRDGPAAYGAVALVLPVRRADGTRAALKLQPVDHETVGESVALGLWAGRGAVRLLAHDETTGAMLLQRLDAGRSLASVPDDLAALEVLAGLLVRLNAVRAPAGMRGLAAVAGATLELVPERLPGIADPAEQQLLRTATAVLRELLAGPVDDALLHWDLHYDNVLATDPGDAAGPWLAIDPKPLGGDAGFELLPALWNRWDDVVAAGDVARHVRRRFDLMTGVLSMERERAVRWTLVRVLQDAVWDVGLGRTRVRAEHRAVAEALLDRPAT